MQEKIITMEKIIIELTEKQITDTDFFEFEERLNIKFPDEFKDHYLKYNGGSPNANWSEGEEINYPFEKFLSIKYGNDTIENKIKEFQEVEFDFGKRIIFATKGILYTYYIDLSSENYGQIFVRILKTKDIKNGRWEYHCANFSEFINGLNQINYKKK